MLNIIQSISLESGALIVAGISFVICLVASFYPIAKWVLALVVPFLISNLIYWSPVILGRPKSEYIAWAFAFILPWTVSGIIAAVTAAYIGGKYKIKYMANQKMKADGK